MATKPGSKGDRRHAVHEAPPGPHVYILCRVCKKGRWCGTIVPDAGGRLLNCAWHGELDVDERVLAGKLAQAEREQRGVPYRVYPKR